MAEQKVKLKKRKAKRRICTPTTQPTTHLQFCREQKYRQADRTPTVCASSNVYMEHCLQGLSAAL